MHKGKKKKKISDNMVSYEHDRSVPNFKNKTSSLKTPEHTFYLPSKSKGQLNNTEADAF